jgi:hypothetical protein
MSLMRPLLPAGGVGGGGSGLRAGACSICPTHIKQQLLLGSASAGPSSICPATAWLASMSIVVGGVQHVAADTQDTVQKTQDGRT